MLWDQLPSPGGMLTGPCLGRTPFRHVTVRTDGHLGGFQFLAVMDHCSYEDPCTRFCADICSLLLGTYLGAKLLGTHDNSRFNPSTDTSLFSTADGLFHTSMNRVWVPISPQLCQHLLPAVFFLNFFLSPPSSPV